MRDELEREEVLKAADEVQWDPEQRSWIVYLPKDVDTSKLKINPAWIVKIAEVE